MKKLFVIFLISAILCSIGVNASAIEMYAPDGRIANIDAADVEAWKNVGWYDYPVTTIYAPDGRTMVIAKSDVAAWKSVGWYDYPVTTVYAMDGRSAVIATTAVNDWVNVGWRTTNYITMYAPDGRTANVSLGNVAAWKNVGWYDYPVTIMYAFDGRTSVVALADVTAWQNVGWFKSKEDIYHHVAKMVIGGYYDPLWYYQPAYSCLDMGTYYILIDWPTYGANGTNWHKVYKNGTIEYLFSGSDLSGEPFADFIYTNYDLPVYRY